ncbi:hypothetical protein [Mucilaginibacter sp. FT3.2]|uniref:hypothetical protein n=1 Tax=Mucilaginibacter sp. FT3.2 TaxID=2723090 RepID=UPI001609FEAD|nr:hypothetical protein [Mucilaginibacter sp. FT3.2]MBB6234518.1 hypothetical protein [Mucilaginibacter sp. FT3.2]
MPEKDTVTWGAAPAAIIPKARLSFYNTYSDVLWAVQMVMIYFRAMEMKTWRGAGWGII